MSMEALAEFRDVYVRAWLEEHRGEPKKAQELWQQAGALTAQATKRGATPDDIFREMKRALSDLEDDHGLFVDHGLL